MLMTVCVEDSALSSTPTNGDAETYTEMASQSNFNRSGGAVPWSTAPSVLVSMVVVVVVVVVVVEEEDFVSFVVVAGVVVAVAAAAAAVVGNF